MSRASGAVAKGLELSLSAVRHAGWWLRWHTDRRAFREDAACDVRLSQPAGAERPAA